MPRLLAIGDIHGCATALRNLIEFVQIHPEDTVVTLGDYVDRGPDSKGVIEQLIALRDATTLIPVRGNHEVMMLRAMESRAAMHEWVQCGGDTTCDSYHVCTVDDFPVEHLEFLRSCVKFHEAPSHFFVHANADPLLPLSSQSDHTLFWAHLDDEPAAHISGKTMVCGHTPQWNGRPRKYRHAICIDTDAHNGGWLTCLDVEKCFYWQANEDGSCRTDVL